MHFAVSVSLSLQPEERMLLRGGSATMLGPDEDTDDDDNEIEDHERKEADANAEEEEEEGKCNAWMIVLGGAFKDFHRCDDWSRSGIKGGIGADVVVHLSMGTVF
ncbi:hypothetical protein CVT25_005518 [Psilocybe cyanescens]|uniref:Uncharacterized protein n=1 Tax=Psilocybe cyanescens TaxID=93625 RepID=A0A409X697_PSICY|nr:hypothetical protein CVT25_005518 [Psilocybe cyanescens]